MKSSFVKIAICVLSGLLVSSCNTVQGTVKGAGKDVSAITGAGQHSTKQHHYKHKAKQHKQAKHGVKKTTKVEKITTTNEMTDQSQSTGN